MAVWDEDKSFAEVRRISAGRPRQTGSKLTGGGGLSLAELVDLRLTKVPFLRGKSH